MNSVRFSIVNTLLLMNAIKNSIRRIFNKLKIIILSFQCAIEEENFEDFYHEHI